jgi:hypothetical protein
MFLKPLLSITLCLSMFGAVPTRGEDLETVDQVIAKYVEAIGGQDRVDSLKSMRKTGKTVAPNGEETLLTIHYERPDKVRKDFEAKRVPSVQAFDGQVAWYTMPWRGVISPKPMSPDRFRVFETQIDMESPLIDFEAKGHQVELLGKEDLEGSATYKLKVTRSSGAIEFHYIHAERFLPIKLQGKVPMEKGEFVYETKFEDYREVGGLFVAHTLVQTVGESDTRTTKFEKIELDIELPSGIFTMPGSASAQSGPQ